MKNLRSEGMIIIQFYIFINFFFAFITLPCILSFGCSSEIKPFNREKSNMLFFRSLRRLCRGDVGESKGPLKSV